MIIISHRSNLDGPNSATNGENHPDSIEAALKEGFNVEIDIWNVSGRWYLGHNNPQYEVSYQFLDRKDFLIHCKDLNTLSEAMSILYLPDIIFHQNDDGALTAGGRIFTAPGKHITPLSIAVLPEQVDSWDISMAAGVCTDFPRRFK